MGIGIVAPGGPALVDVFAEFDVDESSVDLQEFGGDESVAAGGPDVERTADVDHSCRAPLDGVVSLVMRAVCVGTFHEVVDDGDEG